MDSSCIKILLSFILTFMIIIVAEEGFEINLENLTDNKKVKNIVKWLTKVNEKEIYYKTPKLPNKLTTVAYETTTPTAYDNYDGTDLSYDLSEYDDFEIDLSEYIFEDYFTTWYSNITHQASRILNETKDLLHAKNKTALRLLELYSIDGALYYSTPKDRQQLKLAEENMEDKFFSAIANESKTCPQRPIIYKLVMKNETCDVLKCIWESWHDEVGGAIRDDFEKIVKLANGAAIANGYKNVGEVWKIKDAENENASQMMTNLMRRVMPLYKQLHAYVRWKLFKYYSKTKKHSLNHCLKTMDDRSPIPAHLTGNLINQEWSDLIDIVLPYPKAPLPNFKEMMERKKYVEIDMARKANDFFTSLGFNNMTEGFWKFSQFKKTDDNELGCHAYAQDFLKGDNYRIQMCANLTIKDFGIVHHEMGHVVAWMEAKGLPYKFSHDSNKIFGEALGDGMALSATSIEHLKKIFEPEQFCKNTTSCRKQDINALMRSALYNIPLIPYSFVLEDWRYKVFCGLIKPDEYNTKWWEMRLEYQGIQPPSNRSDKDKLDPGSIIHVALNFPYAKYFFSLFVQFQLHHELCKVAGHNEALHKCDIFGSKAAGAKLRKILKQGGSKPTIKLLRQLTNMTSYTADPILEYYKPLMDWLQKNKDKNKYKVGWNKFVIY